MCFETFESGERRYGRPELIESVARQLLHSHLSQELFDAKAAVTARTTVCRQHMVSAAAVVTDRLG